MIGDHVIKSWSKTQSLVALSSAESEFYATVKAATEAMGILALMSDFHRTATVRMHVDASAALGVIQRQGIGKIRHLATSALWLQSQQLRKILRFSKILGATNPADLFTKHVSRELMIQHVTKMKACFREGRAKSTVQLHTLKRKIRQVRAQIKLRNQGHMKVRTAPLIEVKNMDVNFMKFSDGMGPMMEAEFDAWKHKQCSQCGIMRRKICSVVQVLNGDKSLIRESL